METIFDRIQKLCKIRNITIAALERECGLGNATIKKWGISTPSGDKLAKVADYFNVTTDYLLGRVDPNIDQKILSNAYFKLMKNAEEKGIPAEDIQDAIMLLERARKRDQQAKRD